MTRQALDDYLRISGRKPGQCLFPGRRGPGQHLTTRQYARRVGEWISAIGLDPLKYATHSMRRTKATLIYRRTGNLRAVQLLLGHTKIEKHSAISRRGDRRCARYSGENRRLMGMCCKSILEPVGASECRNRFLPESDGGPGFPTEPTTQDQIPSVMRFIRRQTDFCNTFPGPAELPCSARPSLGGSAPGADAVIPLAYFFPADPGSLTLGTMSSSTLRNSLPTLRTCRI